jgi:hypothetical protein
LIHYAWFSLPNVPVVHKLSTTLHDFHHLDSTQIYDTPVANMSSSHQLQEAIEFATHERLKKVLLSICSKSEEASKLAAEELLVQDSASNKRKPNNKHSALRYEMCRQCDKEFDTTTNGPDSCRWHKGKALHAFVFP